MDPLELRLRNLSDDRLAEVLRRTAATAGWGGAERGTAIGIACGLEKDARVATCAVVSSAQPESDPRIERFVTAFDCGAVVDRDNLVNQIEGATLMALGGALFESIRFEDGCILNGSMTDYRVPRFRDVPPVEVVVIDRPDVASAGAGETPMIAVAPAIANALFALTGERRRSMPISGKRA